MSNVEVWQDLLPKVGLLVNQTIATTNTQLSLPNDVTALRFMKKRMGTVKYDLEDRLVDFSVLILSLTEQMPDYRICNHLAAQIIRSSTCPALTYGEAQAAESRRDFIHKLRVALKELRETRINLKIVERKKCLKDESLLQRCMKGG